jgi:hypothetical protein
MQHTQISESTEFKASYFRLGKYKEDFRIDFHVWSYRGALAKPKWKDVEPGKPVTFYTSIRSIYFIFVLRKLQENLHG